MKLFKARDRLETELRNMHSYREIRFMFHRVNAPHITYMKTWPKKGARLREVIRSS